MGLDLSLLIQVKSSSNKFIVLLYLFVVLYLFHLIRGIILSLLIEVSNSCEGHVFFVLGHD